MYTIQDNFFACFRFHAKILTTSKFIITVSNFWYVQIFYFKSVSFIES